MGQALYRKYRSKSLDEIVGQPHITQTLANALKQNRISHAYLFSGPRGVGKTSLARILAYSVNNLPYDDSGSNMDIIEIDAASNRRIDEIRDLREKVHIAPAAAKYKVYIIDEVHMLTKEAFNALLKTLEEPPAHIIFILATTEVHKLPETIISRTQRFSFKSVVKSDIVNHLRFISKQEKLNINEAALEMLAEHGDGSMRDSIGLLDQVSNKSGAINIEDVEIMLGIPSDEAINSLLKLMLNGGTFKSLISILGGLYDHGFQSSLIAKRLLTKLRASLLEDNADKDKILGIMGSLIDVTASPEPDRYLEIILLRNLPVTDHKSNNFDNTVNITTSEVKSSDFTIEASKNNKKLNTPIASIKHTEELAKPDVKINLIKSKKLLNSTVWPEVLIILKQRHNTLYSVVRMAQPDFTVPGTLKLSFAFAFHQKRLNDDANRQKLSDIIKEITGQTIIIEGLHDNNAVSPELAKELVNSTKMDNLNLTAVSNIFGESELLES
ncbi:MAG TPA: DNA polymerase III subunit gamma/tau [Candidatus Saccharimonadales bacterium]|nr:DNA polymerase III subunit gamma/tau [Candidatus Saccharimonadales bacterium]